MRKGKRTFLGTGKYFGKQRIVRKRKQMPGVREIHPPADPNGVIDR
jgi:hypothetical protein